MLKWATSTPVQVCYNREGIRSLGWIYWLLTVLIRDRKGLAPVLGEKKLYQE